MNVKDALCQAAWLQSAFESAAAANIVKVAKSGLLTPIEHDFAMDVVFPEEAAHGRAFRDFAHAIGEPRQREPRDTSFREMPFDHLYGIHVSERLFLRYTEPLALTYRDVVGPWAEAAFRQTVREEDGHEAWGGVALERLVAGHPEWRPRLKTQRHENIVRLAPLWTEYRAVIDECGHGGSLA